MSRYAFAGAGELNRIVQQVDVAHQNENWRQSSRDSERGSRKLPRKRSHKWRPRLKLQHQQHDCIECTQTPPYNLVERHVHESKIVGLKKHRSFITQRALSDDGSPRFKTSH
jgi:hypothetical protein